MSKLASLLGGMTLTDLAKEILGSQGRGGDTELAHINKREAALLKSQGGSGGVNPRTGMREFQDDFYGEFDFTGSPEQVEAYAAPAAAEQQFGNLGYEGLPAGYQSYEPPVGQPTPPQGGGQVSPTTPEISGFPSAGYEPMDIGFGPGQFTPTARAGEMPGMSAEQFARMAPEAAQPSAEPGFLQKAEGLAKQYPTLTRAAGAAAMGIPGLVRAGQARREAAKTRGEMEQMAAPIREAGQELLGAGRRGELTAPQQQQIQAARAAARQDLSRRGVTSGTAAQQAENRIQELAQRFAQQNIDNGVRLIGAANSYNAAAIQQAYKMNADAATMTQTYFTNLMRAFGALPTGETQPARTA